MNKQANEDAFEPPHCPNPECRHHRCTLTWSFHRDGWHHRRAPPHRVRRFRCQTCRRSFSSQTFRTTYFLKKPQLLPQIFGQHVAGSAYRQMAQSLGVVHSTVLNQVRRLGRHCLLFEQLHGPKDPPKEQLVLDGLRSFEFSQYWPMDVNCLIGGRSHYLRGFNIAPLRRSGRMTEAQRERRKELEARYGKPDPRATEKQVERLLRRATGTAREFTLHADEHRAYPRAIERLEGWRITLHQTSSKDARTPKNPLWPANLLDLIVRHGSKNHTRETIAFSKRAQSVLSRMACLQVWRNWIKGISERDGKRSPSPAMRLGLAKHRLSVEEVLSERLFPSWVELPEELREIYEERVPTRQIAKIRTHELKYAA